MAGCHKCVDGMLLMSDKLRRIGDSEADNKRLQDEISHLMFALDGHKHGSNVAHVLHQDIQGASATRVVSLLDRVVKCVTRVGGKISPNFEYWLPDTLEVVYESFCEKNDTDNKDRLVSLRKQWLDLFSCQTLQDIDERLRGLDAINWPTFEYVNQRTKPNASSMVECMRPPRFDYKSSSSIPSCNEPPAWKLIKIDGCGKAKTSRMSALLRNQPMYIRPPSARRSTTETKLRRSNDGRSSDKENSANFHLQRWADQSRACSSC